MKPSSLFPPSRAFLRRASQALAPLALAAALASCALSGPAPVKHTYLLEPALPSAAATPRPMSVRVGVISVAAPFRGKAFVYREGDLKYEASYYDEFFVAPGAMLAEATVKALTASNAFRRVVPPGATADEGDHVLDGFVSELYADVRDPAKPAAVLAVTFYLSPADAAVRRVLWSRDYRQRVPASDTTSDALARAWNTALSTILADLARDLGAAELPK